MTVHINLAAYVGQISDPAPKPKPVKQMHWSQLREHRVMSTVHCKSGDRILVITARTAYPGYFSDRFKGAFAKHVTHFERNYPDRKRDRSHDDYHMFAYLSLSGNTAGTFYGECYASDYSMTYDNKPCPTSVNYVLNLDRLTRMGIEVTGYVKPKEWL